LVEHVPLAACDHPEGIRLGFIEVPPTRFRNIWGSREAGVSDYSSFVCFENA